MAASKNSDSCNNDSRLSADRTYFRNDKKSDIKEERRDDRRLHSRDSDSQRQMLRQWNFRKAGDNTDAKNLNTSTNINPSPSQRLNSQEKESNRNKHFFSRDHYANNGSLSVEKRSNQKFFSNKGDHYVTKTMGDEIKFSQKIGLDHLKLNGGERRKPNHLPGIT